MVSLLVHGRRFSVTRLLRVVDAWHSGGGDRNDWRWSPPPPPPREVRGDSGEVVDDEDEDEADVEWPWLDDDGWGEVSEEMEIGFSSSADEEEKGFLDISTMLRSDCDDRSCEAFTRSAFRRGEPGRCCEGDDDADVAVVELLPPLVVVIASSSESQEDDGEAELELDDDDDDDDGRGEARKLCG